MSVSSLMIHTCNIQTQANTKSAIGGISTSWTSKATGVSCRVHDADTKVIERFARLGKIVDKTVYFDTDQSLNVLTDRIVFNGDNLVVMDVNNSGGNLGLLFAVQCQKQPF